MQCLLNNNADMHCALGCNQADAASTSQAGGTLGDMYAAATATATATSGMPDNAAPPQPPAQPPPPPPPPSEAAAPPADEVSGSMSAAGVFQSLLTVDHPYLRSLLFCRTRMMMKSKSWLMQRAHRVQHRRHVHDVSVQVKCYLVAFTVHRWDGLVTKLLHAHPQVATSLCARLAMQQQQQQSSDPLASTLRYDTTGSNCAVWTTGSDCVVEV